MELITKKKIIFTPNHERYDTTALLSKTIINEGGLSRKFRTELDFSGFGFWADIFNQPFSKVLALNDYKASDIHFILKTANEFEIEFGQLPAWYLRYPNITDQEELFRFLHAKFYNISWPHQRPYLNHDMYNFLHDQLKIDRVYQFILMNRNDLSNKTLVERKILDSHRSFIEQNELEELEIIIQ